MNKADIVTVARQYVGTPWRHQGRTRSGMDCAGLIIAVTEQLGIARLGRLAYTRLPDTSIIDRMMETYCEPVADPEPGDLLRFAIVGRPQHLAVAGDYENGLSLIHAHQSVGAVCEHRLDEKWQRRMVGAYRIKGIK